MQQSFIKVYPHQIIKLDEMKQMHLSDHNNNNTDNHRNNKDDKTHKREQQQIMRVEQNVQRSKQLL